jgi:Mg-chelatase subunit ChlD
VLFDTSGSTASSLYGEVGLNRLGGVKSFFSAFADRTMAYSFRHVISLITFQSTIEVQTDFTEMFVQFKSLVNLAHYGGQTRLFDALLKATSMLKAFKLKYPKTIPRILALTDGEDT